MDFRQALEQFCAQAFSARGRSRLTVEAYRRDLLQFEELAFPVGADLVSARDPGGADGPTQGRPLQDLDRDAVLRWTLALSERGMSPRSRARKLSALKGFIAWALEYGLLAADPLPRELAPPRSLYLPHALSEAEVLALLDACGGEDEAAPAASLRDRAMLEVLYATGMRVSELCGLRLLDLHLGEGFAMVTGKGDKQRLVPLGQPAIEALRRWLSGGRAALCPQAAGHGEVFLSRRGPISRSQVFRLIKAYAAAAGIQSKVSPHTFRHSCASHMLAHGADLRLVQELLGHSALSTTQVYTHIEKSRLRAVYDQTHPLA